MREHADKLKEVAKRLLKEGSVTWFGAYKEGRDAFHPVPYFADDPEDADKLILNEFCVNSLAKYPLSFPALQGKMGMVVKGCDSLALDRLIKDHRVQRESVYVIGVPCSGVLDAEKLLAKGIRQVRDARPSGTNGTWIIKDGDREHVLQKEQILLDKCVRCNVPNPVVYDELIGDPVPVSASKVRAYLEADPVESMSYAERVAFWSKQFERCLRCFACRNVCPACNCRVCCFDERVPKWLGRALTLNEQEMYHFIRAIHVAGRCVDCGECERVCPVGIPLMKLNHKLMRDVAELFNVKEPYVPGEVEPLGMFTLNDPDHFD